MATAGVTWRTWAEVLTERAGELEQLAIARDEGTLRPEDLFVPTGLRDWDRNGGVPRGVLTVVGAVDGQGKSLVAGHLAQAAASAGLEVAQFVFEDPQRASADRSLAAATGMDSRDLAMVKFRTDDLDRVFAAARGAGDWGARVHYHAGLLTPDQVFEAIKDLQATLRARGRRIGLVLVDYAQAFDDEGKGLESVIRHMAWRANKAAQALDCGFVVFSQVKPEINARGQGVFFAAQKKDPNAWDVSGYMPGPGTQDLQWSSAFGQRGRCVAYVFRPGHYERMLGMPGAKDDRIVFRFAKVNFGKAFTFTARFDGPTGRIFDGPGA